MDLTVNVKILDSDKVRCNWCERIFISDEITVVEDKEFCPHCNAQGYLMDITDEEYENYKKDC